tara:strand:+ start:3290 stop:5158 length:1869 start_codon:yes stop_codon:yes gene_type:complete
MISAIFVNLLKKRMKNTIKNLIILLFLYANSTNAQEITSKEFKYRIINTDFTSEDHDFPIVRENDNYFIIDENEYLIIRENTKSEYAIIIEKSLTEDSYLKTSLRLGPSKDKNACIGIITSANRNFTKALVIEINRNGEYRVKQLNTNNYKYLTGGKRKNGWVRNKNINKEDEYNILEIIDNKNQITLKINGKFIKNFDLKINKEGYSGLMIGPNSKARVSYYYLNSNKELLNNQKSLEKNSLTKINIKNNSEEKREKNESTNSHYIDTISNLQKKIDLLNNNLNIKIEEINNQLTLKERKLKESEYEIQQFENWLKEIDGNEENLNSEIKVLKENLEQSKKQLQVLKDNNNILSTDNTNLNRDLIKNKLDYSSLEKQMFEIKKINKEQSQNFTNNQKEIKNLISTIDRNNTKTRKIKKDLEKANILADQTQKLKLVLVEKYKNENTLTQTNISQLKSIIDKLNLKINEGNIKSLKLENKNNTAKYKIFQLDSIVNKRNIEITDHIETNNYLKKIFVYKDFELNGVIPSKLIVRTEISIIPKDIRNQDSCFTIQMGVFTNLINNFNSLDKIWIENSNDIYTYYYGEFKKAGNASITLNKLIKLGYKNIFILKKKNKNYVAAK